jgi:hypothetical protein
LRIQGVLLTPYLDSNPSSIPDPTTETKGMGEKIAQPNFVAAGKENNLIKNTSNYSTFYTKICH